MTQCPLPCVARENLRRMKRHILAIKPGATNINFPSHRLRALQWQLVTFQYKGKEGSCMISRIDGRCILDWPNAEFEVGKPPYRLF